MGELVLGLVSLVIAFFVTTASAATRGQASSGGVPILDINSLRGR